MEETADVTTILNAWGEDDSQALGKLIPLVYDELHRLAASTLRREWRGHSLGGTSLVHETFLRLARQKRVRCRNRHHFFGISALLMRRYVADYARWHLRSKRHGRQVPLDEVPPAAARRAPKLLHLDQALARLANLEPELAEILDLRFFVGLSSSEMAERLGVSVPTVNRRLRRARQRLRGLLRSGGDMMPG